MTEHVDDETLASFISTLAKIDELVLMHFIGGDITNYIVVSISIDRR